MSYEDDEMMNYDEEYFDQSEPLEIDDENPVKGNYEFLMKDEIKREREKKIEEFKESSSLSSSQSELVLMYYNWKI